MRTKTLLLIPTLLFFTNTFAQDQEFPIPDRYDRRGVAVLWVNDSRKLGMELGEKFDEIALSSSTLSLDTNWKTKDQFFKAVADQMCGPADYGKRILSFLFNRKADGTMDTRTVIRRGWYNASDQDRMIARSSQTGIRSVGDAGFNLVGNNYILVLYSPGLERAPIITTLPLYACLYRIDYSPEVQQQLFDAWIYEDDTAEQAAAKKSIYDDMYVGMTLVGNTKVSATSYTRYADISLMTPRLERMLLRALNKMEPGFIMQTPIYEVNPITAKIGTKEGVTKLERFSVHEYVMASRKGIKTPRKGFVRAVDIADNKLRPTAGSPSASTTFYQISGGRIEPGMTLRESRRMRAGFGYMHRFGMRSGDFLTVDYLMSLKPSGKSHYLLLEAGYGEIDGTFEEHDYYSNSTKIIDTKIEVYSLGIGHSMGFRPVRSIELATVLSVGAEMLCSSGIENKMGGYVTAGVKMNVTVAYPLRVFAGIDGSFRSVNDKNEYGSFNNRGLKRSGVGYTCGINVRF